MRLPPFPSIKKGLSFGEVNPLLGHSIYHSSNQYLTHLFSQVFNHTIIVHFGRGEKGRKKGVLYLCVVFFAIHLDQFSIFQCPCIFRVLTCLKETWNFFLEGGKRGNTTLPVGKKRRAHAYPEKTFCCIKNKEILKVGEASSIANSVLLQKDS